MQRANLFGSDVVLTGNAVYVAHALLDPRQSLWVQFGGAGQSVQLASGFFDLNSGIAQHGERIGQRAPFIAFAAVGGKLGFT